MLLARKCKPGREQFEEIEVGVRYDYRHTNKILFHTVRRTLDECRQRRDEWLQAQGWGKRKSQSETRELTAL